MQYQFTTDKKGVIGITALGIKKGTAAQLAQLNLGDRAKGLVPYYISFKITNESGTDLSGALVGGFHGLLGDGTGAATVSVMGRFPPCDESLAGNDFKAKGSSYLTCKPALAGVGSKVAGADYTTNGAYNTAPNTDYSDEAITWQ